MAAAGWTPNRVQRELGHHDPGFTLRVYTHLFQEHEDEARESLDEAVRQALADAKRRMPEAGVEPARVAPDDLESPASTVPPLRPREDMP